MGRLLREYRPKVRIPNWAPPQPRPPRKRPVILLLVIGWLVAVTLAHGLTKGWLALPARLRAALPAAAATATDAQQVAREQSELAPAVVPPESTLQFEAVLDAPQDTAPLPGCREARDALVATADAGDELPADLARSAWGSLANPGRWAKDCRGPKATRVRLCLVVRAGRLLGVTLRAELGGIELERCVERALRQLSFPPETVARTVQTVLELPARE